MKNFKRLSKAEMKKIAGGTGEPCMSDTDCPDGLICDGTTFTCGGGNCYVACRDSSYNDIGGANVSSCGPPVSSVLNGVCGGYSGYDITKSTCAC